MTKSHLDTLTTEERNDWILSDPEGFEMWYSRMLVVDTQNILRAKKVPRHRFNKDAYEP